MHPQLKGVKKIEKLTEVRENEDAQHELYCAGCRDPQVASIFADGIFSRYLVEMHGGFFFKKTKVITEKEKK